MPLESTLFQDDSALQACAVNDRAHLTHGAAGPHIGKVQFALFATDGLGIDDGELSAQVYGPSTASAVLNYKTNRSIINRAYQSTPDDIVGKMTIASLDSEMLAKEGQPAPVQLVLCGSDQVSGLGRSAAKSSRSGAVTSGVQQVSLRSGLVGGPPGSAVGGPPAAGPREQALGRVGAATSAIAQTRVALAGLINFRPIANRPASAPSLPPGTMALFDKVWRNFGQPTPLPIRSFGQFPQIDTLRDFLVAIDSHYELMQGTLARAATLFQTVDQSILGTNTFALTITNDRIPGDPPGLAVGIHFGDLFASSSPNKQTEVVIHEPAHFVDGHFFGDPFAADSPNWGKFNGGDGILNAWSYSMFVLDVVFDRTTPFPRN